MSVPRHFPPTAERGASTLKFIHLGKPFCGWEARMDEKYQSTECEYGFKPDIGYESLIVTVWLRSRYKAA